jgi:small subunit ribosomal protein S11e
MNSKKVLAKKTNTGPRYYKKIGLGFKTPQAAIEGQYIDHKCPFTSSISIRGRIFKGVVLSTKMRNTVVLRRDYLHYIKKYNRFEKRHHNLPAHCTPAYGRTKTGDIVTVGQCRPISKTVRFNVCRVEKQRVEGNVRKTFIMF